MKQFFTIAIVEDDPAINEMLQANLERGEVPHPEARGGIKSFWESSNPGWYRQHKRPVNHQDNAKQF